MFQHIVQVCSYNCFVCQQVSECPMQRTMLAAVQATDERFIAPRYLMQIFAYLAFFHQTCTIGFVKHLSFCPHKTITECCLLRDNFSENATIFNVYI